MNYKHIAWDWNGTILDDAKACSLALSAMLEKRGMGSVSIEEYRARIEFPVINLYYQAGFDLEKENYEDICDEYITNYINNFSMIHLQKDAKLILEKFQAHGLQQHIVSASGYDILINQIQKYGLETCFANVLGQKDNQADSKVHLAKKLISITGCDPKEVLFIGDTIHDYEVAAEAGFDCRLVANGHCSKERLEATGVPVHPNLTALYNEAKRCSLLQEL